MTEKEKDNWENLLYRIDEEGFDYCFDGYSDWSEIEDEHFHNLRKKYLESVKELQQYVESKNQ